jgi:glycosyltransferase involved in cell wall biosynthesis
VGRFDPIKDHSTFIHAAGLVTKDYPEARFLCIGSGSETATITLLDLVDSVGMKDKFIFTGMQTNMPAVYNALDVLVSSSYGEGFSNVIAEAMACGVPCVVTDVGDSARITGPVGYVIQPKDPVSLARALCNLLNHQASIDHQQIRKQIVDHFSVDLLVQKTGEIFKEICT